MNTLIKIGYGIASVGSGIFGFQLGEKSKVDCALHNYCRNNPEARFDLKHLLGGFRPVYTSQEMMGWSMQRWNQELTLFFAARGNPANIGSTADGMQMFDAQRVTFIAKTKDEFYSEVENLSDALLNELFLHYNWRFQSRLYWHPKPVELFSFTRKLSNAYYYQGFVCRNRFIKHSIEGNRPARYPYHYECDVFLPVMEDYQNIQEYRAAYTPEQREILESCGCNINETLVHDSWVKASPP